MKFFECILAKFTKEKDVADTILVTKTAKSVTKIVNLSSSYFVFKLCRQHRSS